MTKEQLECQALEYARKKYGEDNDVEGDVVQDWVDGYVSALKDAGLPLGARCLVFKED